MFEPICPVRQVVVGLLLLAAAAPGAGLPPMSDDRARALFQKILPPEEETGYSKIPWRLTVLDALVEAQLTDKPILLWQKRGQPMGFV